ncbi:metallophosphoesterase [Planctomicrobium sp. SH661]|uniref:metallophosphoesterase n=1 Tax=Planctomicrobium sp. SH661 TaxID=3448124 RepID=UPI003F5B0853
MHLTRRDVLKLGTGAIVLPGFVSLRTLSAQEASGPYADAILVDGEPPLPEEGSFTIAVLPDTQNYSEHFPKSYLAQTQWIVDQKERRNIACVLHLGDITNRSSRKEWEVARQAMQQLDGHVPYFMVPGNHDYSEGGLTTDRTTLLNEYFPRAAFEKLPTFGGTYDAEPDRMENSYHVVTIGDRKLLVLALEFGPRKDVVRWANDVVGKHPDHEVILITHAYMYYDDTRYDWKQYGPAQHWNPHSYPLAKSGDDVMDGTELWNQLLSRHENFILTLNGHVLGDGLGRMTSQTPGGRDVHQILVNYQMRPNGGDGWLRLLEFRKDGSIVQTYDYSPVLKKRNESPQNQFELKLSPVKVS